MAVAMWRLLLQNLQKLWCPLLNSLSVLSWPQRLYTNSVSSGLSLSLLRHGFLLCLLYHGSLVYLHHHGFLLCLFCHCPMLQVLFPFMGLALHPWTISVPPRLHHPGLLGFCSVWLRHLEPPLGGGGACNVGFWGSVSCSCFYVFILKFIHGPCLFHASLGLDISRLTPVK